MLKNNQLAVFAGASVASIGTYFLYRQLTIKKQQSEYSSAVDNVLSKSSVMNKKSKKSKHSNKKTHFDEEQLKNKSSHENPDETVKAILIESRNKKNKLILQDQDGKQIEIDEEQELKRSFDDFQKVVNSKIKISSAQFDSLGKKIGGRPMRKDSAKNEFQQMITEELQSSAGECNSVCLSRVDEEAYICFTCISNHQKLQQNKNFNQNYLSTEEEEDFEEGEQDDIINDNEDEEENQFVNQLIDTQLDVLGVQRGISDIQQKKEPRKKKEKKSIHPNLQQCELYCWNCVQEHHQNHTVVQICSQQSYININNSANLCSRAINHHHHHHHHHHHQHHHQSYSPKLTADQHIYLTAIREQMELQQYNSQAVGLYCCQLEQILVTEENIPTQIENHLSQELNLIFDVLFDRAKQAETKEFNNLLHIILKRIDEIMLDNNIIIYVLGRILIKRNIIDRVLRYDSLESQNQKRISEILVKMAKIDLTLRSEIAVILLQDFKYVFVSYTLCSALLFMLKSSQVRHYVSQKLNKTSQFCAGLLNIKSIFEKFSDIHKYRNKLIRCLYVTRALCEDRTFVIEGLLPKSTQQFSELLCDVARYLEKKSVVLRNDLFKNIIHTNLADDIFYLKNLDFNFRLLFHDFIQSAHYAPEKYRQLLWQKLSVYLKQNLENYEKEISENTTNLVYLNVTSLNMLTTMQRDIRCNKFTFKPEEYSKQAIIINKKYIFANQEGYQLLHLNHYSSVISNAQNRCLFEHLKIIYGYPEIGDFDLLTLLQQNIKDSSFIMELFSQHNYPSFDLYQNLRILFTDYSNQLGQLIINIFQINHQEMPLSALLKEINKYIHIQNISILNLDIFCQQITIEECNQNYKDKFPNQPIYRLKKVYYNEFFPLIFCKYPEDYNKLIKQQQLHNKLSQFDSHFAKQAGNLVLSGSSTSSEDNLINGPKVLSVNFFHNKENKNDVFGSDYDFILMKDRQIQFHSHIIGIMLPTVKAFFMIEKEDPILSTIIQLYIRIIIFQFEATPTTFSHSSQHIKSKPQSSSISNLIPENIYQKLKSFKTINQYLMEDLQFLKQNNFNPSALQLKRAQSSQ